MSATLTLFGAFSLRQPHTTDSARAKAGPKLIGAECGDCAGQTAALQAQYGKIPSCTYVYERAGPLWDSGSWAKKSVTLKPAKTADAPRAMTR